MLRAKLSDAQPISAPQSGKANLSDVTPVEDNDSTHEFDSKAPVSLSAPPKVGSIPWMKQKAYATLTWGANQLPAVEGTIGGAGGALLGEVADPLGGGVPGAIVGAGVGGAHGEYDRQRIIDAAGLDPYADPKTKTVGHRTLAMAKEGLNQAGAEVVGIGAGLMLRPTLGRSLAKLYNAGGIDYGDGMGQGRLKTVIKDLMETEKAPGGKAVTIQDFVNTIDKTKEEVGAKADTALNAPVSVGGKTVLLRDMAPDPVPISNLIKNFATKDGGIIKRASLTGSDPSVTAAKKYLRMIKDRALTFEQKPWTYGQLATERMRINRELSDFYAMTPGEKQTFLKENPLFEVDKAIADHIRDVTYPEMDKAAGFPKGTTKSLQEKRGILMQMDTEVRKNLQKLQNKTVQMKGEGLADKVSPSGYITSEGKPGGSFHRIQRVFHTPSGVASADKKVSQAFGHAPLTKLRKGITTPFGSKKAGNEILASPVRELVEHFKDDQPTPPPQDGDDDFGPQSSVARPKDLIEKAKKMNPAASGQTAYTHVAVNPATGHRIGSNSGREWFDIQTGARIA
jgi:hypothetical protein